MHVAHKPMTKKKSKSPKKTTGRPPKYSTPDEMLRVGTEYFDARKAAKKPVTVTGLCLALGFTSRQALINYEGKPEFVDTVKTLKLMVEHFCEQALFLLKNPTGPIFALKNFGWSDRETVEHTGAGGGPLILNVVYEDEKELKDA